MAATASSIAVKRQQNEVDLERPNHASMFTFLIKLLHNPERRLLKDEIILRKVYKKFVVLKFTTCECTNKSRQPNSYLLFSALNQKQY